MKHGAAKYVSRRAAGWTDGLNVHITAVPTLLYSIPFHSIPFYTVLFYKRFTVVADSVIFTIRRVAVTADICHAMYMLCH